MSSNNERERFFTGRQVTTMVVALMAAVVLFPTTVWAVDTFSNVAIMDPVSGVKAKVDNARKLTVGDGVGNLTVDGTVIAPEAQYNTAKHWSRFNAVSEGCVVLATPSSGKALVLKSLNLNTFINPSPGAGHFVSLYYGPSNTPCNRNFADVNPPGIGVETLDLGSGLVLPAGQVLAAFGFGEVRADVLAFGYEIPAASAPVATASATEEPAAPKQQSTGG